MADRKVLSGVLIGIFVVVAIAIFVPVSDEAIPPTPAYETIYIFNNVTFPSSGPDSITALRYNDDMAIVSDGSILINITNVELP